MSEDKGKERRIGKLEEGEVSNSIDFRDTRDEVFLFDTGAGVSIIAEAIAIDNKIKVYKLRTPHQIVEASGNALDIIGSCEIYCKIPILKTIKKLKCLVLLGNFVDREILVSCETLKKWDIVHSTFGQETVTNYINRCKLTRNLNNLTPRQMNNKIKNVSKLSQLYAKSKVPTDELLDKVPTDCIKLREKILRNHHKNFKEKLGPNDRVNCAPVKLEIDKSRGINPVKHTKAYDIPIHLRKAATAEFTEMRKAGIVVESKGEASEWSYLAFPRKKPNSWPIKC